MAIPMNLPQRNSIQGLWHLDELSGVRYDVSGNSNTLQDNNTVLYGTGKIGNAANFELDTSESLSITDALQTGLDITGNMTVSAWIKRETDTDVMIVAGKYLNTDNKRCWYVKADAAIFDKKLEFTVSDNGEFAGHVTSIISDTEIVTGSWYHTCVIHDATNNELRLYVAGVSDAVPVAHATGIADKTSSFEIGSRYTGTSDYFDGLIDEVIVWNTCLTAAEVLQVKNITAYTYGTGNFFIFFSQAYKKNKEHFKNKLWIPNNEILVPQGI